MGRMQRILESYRNEILAKNPHTFALLAEGPLEQLRQLQRQIDDYLACTSDERRQIDLLAEGKAAPLLKVVSEDKRAGVLEEARREAARAFLSKKS
jgi:hypothetical protein